jgi:hypothetical protein
VLKLVEKFVPVLVDGAKDKEFGARFGVSGYPNTVFVDPKGNKVSVVTGYVETGRFADAVRSALKKIGSVQVRKQVKELEEASAALAKAREKSDWKAALKAAATIEKINHDGPALVDARKAKADAEEEAKKRLDAAKGLIKDGKAEEAKAALGKIASTFEGLDAAVEAKNLLKELAGPAEPKDGGGDGGGGEKKGKK